LRERFGHQVLGLGEIVGVLQALILKPDDVRVSRLAICWRVKERKRSDSALTPGPSPPSGDLRPPRERGWGEGPKDATKSAKVSTVNGLRLVMFSTLVRRS
jgi:hypothetical protein